MPSGEVGHATGSGCVSYTEATDWCCFDLETLHELNDAECGLTESVALAHQADLESRSMVVECYGPEDIETRRLVEYWLSR